MSLTSTSETGSAWRWYKGNLHAHTDRSDGRLPPSVVADWYSGQGYDFLAITDHGRVTSLESPHNELLIVPGIEVTALDERSGVFFHIVALFEPRDVPAVSSLKVASPQATVDSLLAARGTVVLAHPYWLGVSSAETGAVAGPVAVEIYNHLCELERGRGFSEQQWDELLLAGRRLWGVASDDCHFRMLDAGGGWVMLRARELTPAAILEAFRRGDFYSTQGPEVKRWGVQRSAGRDPLGMSPEEVAVECSPCRKVIFYADRWLGSVVEAPSGPGEQAPLITSAKYVLTGKESYVRAVCIDEAGRRAWTNPVFFDPCPGQGMRRGRG
jgi:hypothetical protein